MTIPAETLSRELTESLGRLGERTVGYARLGTGDGSGTIVADFAYRKVYYFDRDSSQVPAIAPLVQTINLIALNHPDLEGVRIRLGYPPYNPKVLHVLGLDTGEGLDSVSGITAQEQLTAKTLYPSVGNLTNFRLSPQKAPDTTVFVNASPFFDTDGVWSFWGGDSLDLAATIAALSSGEHQMVLICLDTVAASLVILTNTASAGGQADKDVFDWTTISTIVIDVTFIPVGAVHLYEGQTEVVEDDIYRNADPRAAFGKQGRTGDVFYQTVQDNGTPVAQEPVLNFVGATVTPDTGKTTITIPTTGITQLTGDVTAGPGSGSQAATLATVNGAPGSFTNASLTVNGKGLVTAVSSGTAPVTNVTASSPLASSGGATPNISLSDITTKLIFDEWSETGTPSADTDWLYAADDNGYTFPRVIDSNATILQLFRDQMLVAKNTTGLTIAANSVVGIDSATGGILTIKKADADALILAIDITLDNAVNNAFTRVQLSGVCNFDTSGFSAGNILYLSTTAGSLTATAPSTPPTYVQRVAVALDSSASGHILILPFVSSQFIPFNNVYIGGGSTTSIIAKSGPTHTGTLQIPLILTGDRIWEFPDADGTVALTTTVAPIGATYITQTPDATLTAEHALSALSSGLMKVTTGTGIVSSVAAPTGAVVGTSDTQVFTNKKFDDGTTINDSAGATGDFIVKGDTDNNTLVVDVSADSVGIGTATPTAKLNVEGAVIINDTSADVDVRIESDGDANNFFSDGGVNSIGIGTGTPNASAKLHVVSTTQGSLAIPVMTTTQRNAISSPAEGLRTYETDTQNSSVYDSQRYRSVGDIGWTPYAYPVLFSPASAYSTFNSLAANGGSMAVPMLVQGHLLLQSVSVLNDNVASARTWGWDLYVEYLNNGNSGENTLARVANSTADETFTPAAASIRTINAASVPVYLAPGVYWLVIQCRHATNPFAIGIQAAGGVFAVNTAQTKTTVSPNGATLDFVAATWTKITDTVAARLNGRTFGQVVAF